ncbi:hypothetical protein [Streptomyces sp. NPDC005262]|uniref:hypothetical protein n=1 Tax=Streptomyces sp. NPDC005262 TaxID=3364710 RepID=UPI0036A41676
MTTAESGASSSAALEEYLSLIDELLAQPFPETDFYDNTGCGGRQHRVRILRASQEADPDEQLACVCAVEELAERRRGRGQPFDHVLAAVELPPHSSGTRSVSITSKRGRRSRWMNPRIWNLLISR